MKKKYIKPQIIFESFELSQSISTGCDVIANNFNKGQCGFIWNNMGVLFAADAGSRCDILPAHKPGWGKGCWNSEFMTDYGQTFGS